MVRKSPKKKKERKTNPNGVNQYTPPDPRQALFLSLYLNPKSKSFGNAYRSAIGAKYSDDYAKIIMSTLPEWLSENLRKKSFVEKAEQHFEEVLDIPILVQAMGAFGPLTKKIPTGKFKIVTKKGKRRKVEIFNEEPIMVYAPSLIKEKTKVAEVVAEAHDRKNYGKNALGKGNVFNFTQINEDREAYS